MRFVTIVLFTLIIVITYILINILYSKNVLIQQNYLKTGLLPIKLSSLKNYQDKSYYYEIWIYVNKLDTTTTSTIMEVGKSSADYNFSLEVGKNIDSRLYIKSKPNSSANNTTEYVITPSLQLQKWQQVLISVQNTLLDLYLNGKLVKSITLTSTDSILSPPNDSTQIKFGVSDIYIAKLNRQSSNLNTRIAWNSYLQGNSNMIPIHATLELTSENITTNKYNLF